MKLNEEQYQKLIKHITEKWQSPPACSVCRNNDWNVSREVYELREFHGGSMVIGGSALVPVSPVTCNNCGNVVLVNTLVAGIDLKGGSNA